MYLESLEYITAKQNKNKEVLQRIGIIGVLMSDNKRKQR